MRYVTSIIDKFQPYNFGSVYRGRLEVSMIEGKIPSDVDRQNSENNKNNRSESINLQRRYSVFFQFAPVGYFTFDRG